MFHFPWLAFLSEFGFGIFRCAFFYRASVSLYTPYRAAATGQTRRASAPLVSKATPAKEVSRIISDLQLFTFFRSQTGLSLFRCFSGP